MSFEHDHVCAVTGASGYVGSILANRLKMAMPVIRMIRRPETEYDVRWSFDSTADQIAKDLRSRSVHTLVHAAWDMTATSLESLNRVCVKGSAALFEAAALAGVKRIIFISSISAFEGCRSNYGTSKLLVERMLQPKRAVVLRPGLVFGCTPGGVFGGLRQQVCSKRFLPLIGDGSTPQYLLHEDTLAETALSAVRGDLDHLLGEALVLAHWKPWPFRELLQSIADAEHRKVTMLPIPWQFLFYGMRIGELLNLKLPFRSDSVMSFIYSNKSPDFTLMRSLGIVPIPYLPNVASREEQFA